MASITATLPMASLREHSYADHHQPQPPHVARRHTVELARITEGCTGRGTSRGGYVLTSLADHALCEQDHAP